MNIEDHLPLTETTFFILLSMSTRSMHGYAIMKEVRLLSQERIVLSTGTLYGALKRLLDLGWIERTEDDEPAADQRERKTYILTKLGRRALDVEIKRLGKLVALANRYAADGQI